MLYVDPEVGDPKLVAGLLEKAASRVLRSCCVFDVATDIVEALADVRGDSMLGYRGVFVNESLYREAKMNEGKRSNRSIQGKHLSQFFRQAGMSAARMVLLVTGDLEFDVGNAAAHGLSAVLRKPFTGDGFCDVLSGIFSGESPGTVPHFLPTQETDVPSNSKVATSHPCVDNNSHSMPPGMNHNQHEQLTSGSKTGVKSTLTAAGRSHEAIVSWSSAVARSSDVPVQGSAVYPECLNFTPIPASMLSNFQFAQGTIQAKQGLDIDIARKCLRNVPREVDEAAIPARMPEEPSRDWAVLPAATAGAAVDQAGNGPTARVAGGCAAGEWEAEESVEVDGSARNVSADRDGRDLSTAPMGGLVGEPGHPSTVSVPKGVDESEAAHSALGSSRGGLWRKRQEVL